MAQASKSDESRERAVSSEPCSTRPNPFDDSDIASRKRRRTSLSGASRSRSVDTVTSSPGSLADGDLASEDPGLEAKNDSAMKIDTDLDADPAIPSTPEQRPLDAQPPSGPRSSRVTINVRTPSRPLEAVSSSPSSPSSPSPTETTTAALFTPEDDVKISVEESEVDMSREDTILDTPVSSASDSSSSPPIEVVPVHIDDDDGDDFRSTGEPEVTIFGDYSRSMLIDPSSEFPFRENAETFPEAATRLTQYLTTHETVSQSIADWIEGYLAWARSAPLGMILESHQEHRDLWQSIPDLVLFVTRQKVLYPRNRPIRQAIFAFYRVFATLTAFFIEIDIKSLRNVSTDSARLPDLASPFYVQALNTLVHNEDAALDPPQTGNEAEEMNYFMEMMEVLDRFQKFHMNQGGTLAYINKLAQLESELVPRFPRLTDYLGQLCLLTSVIIRQSSRRFRNGNFQANQLAWTSISRGYILFKTMSATLSSIVERNINYLSQDGTTNLLSSLTEIYHVCLSTKGIVSSDILKEHRESHPPIDESHLPEGIAATWKFTIYSKLIMSSQMQLRVMAANSMCTDLVGFHKKYHGIEPIDDSNNTAMLNYLASFLLRSGLVAYLLGPTCHPEVTTESSNIIGFLIVSHTYTAEHTDTLWQTVTSTQDPRVSDALLRMITRIAHLFPPEGLLYLCEKLNTVPVEAFSLAMRELSNLIVQSLGPKTAFEKGLVESAPYRLCVRLIRQSSVLGPQSSTCHSEVQQFAILKLKDLISTGLNIDDRKRIYADCLGDIKLRTSSAIGNLWVLSVVTRGFNLRELAILLSQHDLAGIMVEELDAAITVARNAPFPAVLSGPQNTPRKDLLMNVLFHDSPAINEDLGPNLWHLLVGAGAASREDRDVAWQLLNFSMKRPHSVKSFISTCFSEYLPSLAPEYFCLGALEFVRGQIIPLVEDVNSVLLDDDEDDDHGGIAQLWRMILTSPDGTIETQAIQTLVNDVYLDSRSISSFSHYRARKVHLNLVGQCLRQLSSAAATLRGLHSRTASCDDEVMTEVATDHELRKQELTFIRSLAVLSEFHRLHQAKEHFSAPDVRSLILDSPSPKDIEGDLAELKYQSFDGDEQSDVKPLRIGKKNTAAALLATLREVTGFNSYRIYYKGGLLIPKERDIGKSLEDLQIQNGIMLVKREEDIPASPTRIRHGASSVEVEILGHFDELWEYLSMDAKFAQEVYNFLVKLPADEKVIKVLEDPSTSCRDIFPLGQPFQSLYAVHALREHLTSQRDKLRAIESEAHDSSKGLIFAKSLARTMSLVVSAISDPEILNQCPNVALQIELSSSLLDCFVFLLQDPLLPVSAAQYLDTPLLDHLLNMMPESFMAAPEISTRHITLCLGGILDSCPLSSIFMSAFRAHPKIPTLLETLLLHDQRPEVRHNTIALITEKISHKLVEPDPVANQFRAFTWPLVSSLVGPAMASPVDSYEILDLCYAIFVTLRDFQTLNYHDLLLNWGNLLLDYTTYEDVTKPGIVDRAVTGLIRLLHGIICSHDIPGHQQEMLRLKGVARKIFWKHLYPPMDGRLAPSRPILSQDGRTMLFEMIFSLVEGDQDQIEMLLEDLNELVPVYPEEEDLYGYEFLQQFERAKAIRAPCGYVGLKNLSNTCYLNSLFTQLYMNVNFRQFMLKAEVQDGDYSQNLLFQTQRLFAHLQGSIRRFANPEDCVSCIKTYEDGHIDIHNQMDVDEFYNLLIDRWESQLLTSDEKRQFHSFYGGQLVQQVKSKECEHISERLEPFSAIQCDIKGKMSLEDSLQAYVDGEIMSGDNRYKCSTCDRHVDASKRACLKDIPDNLIFHLKRFDFNLRTVQRSKINDYFSFPNKINMRPYTIEHLSGEDTPDDIFELVGVLVHSGTAESGHYYSYIRERPTSGDSQVWVEFNDDVVTSWDPAQMETSCFGGPDYRSQFDNNGVIYDKTYSAYMLFYERSTSVAKNQQLLRQCGYPSPFSVDVSPDLAGHIQLENEALLRRHCLYDPSQIKFVNMAIGQLQLSNEGKCSSSHRLENLAMTAALSHLDQVASRTKDIPDFFALQKRIDAMCEGCAKCSVAVFEYFDKYNEPFRMLVQKNPDADVRQGIVDLMIRVLQHIKAAVPYQYGIRSADDSEDDDYGLQQSTMAGVMRLFRLLWDNFHLSLRSWPEVFDFMLSFVKIGRNEMATFLEQPFLWKLLMVVSADASLELPPQFARMITTVSRRMATRPPSYECIIALIDVLVASMQFYVTEDDQVIGLDTPEQRLDRNEDLEEPFHYTRQEVKIIHHDWGRGLSNIFVEKLVSINQNQPATYNILVNLMRQSPLMEEKVFRTLRLSIGGQITQHHNTPYLRAAALFFCRVASHADFVNRLIAHVIDQCMCLQNSEGRSFFEFQRDVFDGPRENTGEDPEDILMAGFDNVPRWAPGLLVYFDPAVSGDVEVFLQEKLFRYGPSPVFEDTEQGRRRAAKITETAKVLGFRCLEYLRDSYVTRNVDVSRRVVEGPERVIRECGKFFNPMEVDEYREFSKLSQGEFSNAWQFGID
ncbi:hypothetical protein B0T17DRAFT_231975 [Bombardia bombarda]|uniref:USP domain-containing protein n=1 Tax=Bombardia bombarda TaxID=252184 RepID=A0AA40C9V0_9PEZI|nr:hypothetical protein B0T17DRAFT_231975 [Bombardia bombarda]